MNFFSYNLRTHIVDQSSAMKINGEQLRLKNKQPFALLAEI